MYYPKTITLTLNPSIDHIITVESLLLYQKNLIIKSFTFYGGKGINVAYALGKLGIDCIATGFIGERDSNTLFQKLSSVSVKSNFVTISGDTRSTYKVMDMQVKKDTEFNQLGFAVLESDIAKLNSLMIDLIRGQEWLAMSGSLPPGLNEGYYFDLITQARQSGVKTCLDTSSKALCAGIAAKPNLLRINLTEFEGAIGQKLYDNEQIVDAAVKLITGGIEMVVISMGKRGIIGSNGKETWVVRVPEVKVVSLTGAGDTLTAGCLYALSQGKSFKDMLQFSGALATASTLKMQPGDFNFQDLSQIMEYTVLYKN